MLGSVVFGSRTWMCTIAAPALAASIAEAAICSGRDRHRRVFPGRVRRPGHRAGNHHLALHRPPPASCWPTVSLARNHSIGDGARTSRLRVFLRILRNEPVTHAGAPGRSHAGGSAHGWAALVRAPGCAAHGRQPAKVIILRHGEKANATALCGVGVSRSLAAGAAISREGAEKLAVQGTARRRRRSWRSRCIRSSWFRPRPRRGTAGHRPGRWCRCRRRGRRGEGTGRAHRAAAADVMGNPACDGKIVVMRLGAQVQHPRTRNCRPSTSTDGVTLPPAPQPRRPSPRKDHVARDVAGRRTTTTSAIVEYPAQARPRASSFKHDAAGVHAALYAYGPVEPLGQAGKPAAEQRLQVVKRRLPVLEAAFRSL